MAEYGETWNSQDMIERKFWTGKRPCSLYWVLKNHYVHLRLQVYLRIGTLSRTDSEPPVWYTRTANTAASFAACILSRGGAANRPLLGTTVSC